MTNPHNRVTRAGMETLAAGSWINKKIIDYVVKTLIALGERSVRAYTSHFMDTLLGVHREKRGYNYSTVERYGRIVEGNIANLDELYVPINANSNHWNLIRVLTRKKEIELWYSLGPKIASNKTYLEAMLRYIYDELHRTAQTNDAHYYTWMEGWKCHNKSGYSPRQTNGDDYGLFTLASVSFLRNHMRLTADAYSQETIVLRDFRLRLALAIWKSGIEGPEYPCCPGPLGEEVEAGGARLPPSKRVKQKRRDMVQRQRKQSGQRLVLGKTRIQGQGYMVTFLKKEACSLLNKKRSAVSVDVKESNVD